MNLAATIETLAKVIYFRPMKITQDLRDFAANQGVSEQEALEKGMEAKSVEFVKEGASIYRKA